MSASAARDPPTTRISRAGCSIRASRACRSTRIRWSRRGCSSPSPPPPPSHPDAARSAAREMADLRFRRLAIAVVEGFDCDLGERRLIEAAEIDAVAVGVGARHVERFHAAVAAEQMLRGAGVEAVLTQRLRA